MDGAFDFNGETIRYKIVDNSSEDIRVVRGKEKMTNISSQDASKWYEEYLANK